ncbi:hypothetical protein [Nocardioides sp.]|uniref:DUF2304 domain-containing protein n=1 Tax=Nocardioides sp. TaxID=35761 RepID=UPI002D7F91A3|nr:hypothetical protein [Nocardioides sp.]HET8961511.1 hypothetical protein [Nocardioides sp.]
MNDSNSGDTSGSPYGPPPSQNPYGQPTDPHGQPPPQQSPYGEAPQQQSPYGEGPQQSPQGQPAQPPAYGPPPTYGQPAPYGQQPGYGQPGYPYGGPASDKRPGTVTAASVITLIFSGLSLLLFAFGLIGLVVAKADVLSAFTEEPEFEDLGISADAAFGGLVAIFGVFLVWCLIACILAVLVLRRSNAARITLVVSASVTAVLSLLGIGSGVSAIFLLAGVAVIVLLFVGGANDWFKGKPRQTGQTIPGVTQY